MSEEIGKKGKSPEYKKCIKLKKKKERTELLYSYKFKSGQISSSYDFEVQRKDNELITQWMSMHIF